MVSSARYENLDNKYKQKSIIFTGGDLVNIQVENHIEINGEDRLMSSLTDEERSNLWQQANERALGEIGFKKVKQKDKSA